MEENIALRQARISRGWRQVDVAHLLTVHRSTVIRWEHGTVPEAFWQEKLCTLFGMNAAQLGFTQDPPMSKSEALWSLPYPRNPFFTGREEVLERLHDTLAHESSALISQSYALSGLGGIGKTQTAIEYAYRYGKDYTAVFWISAETNEGIVSSFVAIAELLNLPEKEQSRITTAVTRWLTSHNDWLLIFDNVEDLELVKKVLPPAHYGSILFTSRRQALSLSAHTLDLEKMTQGEGMLFLLHRARLLKTMTLLDSVPSEEKNLAAEIVAAMDGLPLALDQAGAYIEATQCSLSNYLSLFHSFPLRLLEEREAHMDHPLSVTRTFALAFERLERTHPAAVELLTVCAFLASEDIPEMFFVEGAKHLESPFEELTADHFAFQSAIKALLTYSLIQRNQNTQTFTMHRLVQAVLKGRLSKEVQRTWKLRVLSAMTHLFPSDKIQIDYWRICERLLPHAQVCLTQWGTDEDLHIIPLLSHVANYLYNYGRLDESEHLFEDVLRIREQTAGPDQLDVAVSLNDLATLYQENGKYVQAEPLFQRTLDIRKQQLDSEHPLLARSYNKLAGLYREQGRYDEAEPLYQQALNIWEQTKGPEHILVAYPLNNLGNLYNNQGKYELAMPLFQRALDIWEQAKGPEDPELSYPLEGLAHCFSGQMKYKEAESLFQRALDLREQTFGSGNYLLAEPLIGLATIYSNQSKYTQAESLFQRALDVREQTFGSTHHRLAEPLIGLATIYSNQSKYAQAESLFQRALTLSQQQLVSNHPDIATILYQLGKSHQMQQQTAEALSLYQQALTIRQQVFGVNHPKTLEIMRDYDNLVISPKDIL